VHEGPTSYRSVSQMIRGHRLRGEKRALRFALVAEPASLGRNHYRSFGAAEGAARVTVFRLKHWQRCLGLARMRSVSVAADVTHTSAFEPEDDRSSQVHSPFYIL
jgi:hypothetical protein